MSLPTGTHAADTEYLQRLYDEYCKILLNNFTNGIGANCLDLLDDIPDRLSKIVHQCATAMLNERKK